MFVFVQDFEPLIGEQKKLMKLVTDFVQSEAMQELLDGVERYQCQTHVVLICDVDL